MKPKLIKSEAQLLGQEIRRVRREKNQSVAGAVAEANLFLMRYGQEGKVTKNDWNQMEQYGVGLAPILLFQFLFENHYLVGGGVFDCLWNRPKREDAGSSSRPHRREQVRQTEKATGKQGSCLREGDSKQCDDRRDTCVGESEGQVPCGDLSECAQQEGTKKPLSGRDRVSSTRRTRKRKNLRQSHGSRGDLRVQVTTGGVRCKTSTPIRSKEGDHRKRKGKKG